MTRPCAVLLLLALAVPAGADTAKGVSVWPGLAWAAVPAGVDVAMTHRCLESHTCAEANTAGGTKVWTAVAVTGSVAVQTYLDKRLRERGVKRSLWVMRGAAVALHGYLAVHAWRLDRAGVKR